MLYGAQIIGVIKLYSSDYGFNTTLHKFDWTTLITNHQVYIDRIHTSYKRILRKNKIEVINGFAKFVDAKTVEVNGKHYIANNILLAVGGEPPIPNLSGSVHGIDSNDFFKLNEQPKRVAVIGADYIAIEIAGIFNALGTDTHLFVRKKSPLQNFAPMIINALVEGYRQKNLTYTRIPHQKSDERNRWFCEASL